MSVVSKCSQHFHYACIQKWINKNLEEGLPDPKCPCCQKEIKLYY